MGGGESVRSVRMPDRLPVFLRALEGSVNGFCLGSSQYACSKHRLASTQSAAVDGARMTASIPWREVV